MKVSQPITKLDFIRLFKKLKIKKGSDILVHSSLITIDENLPILGPKTIRIPNAKPPAMA